VSPLPLERAELFDRAADPGEGTNIAEQNPEVVATLRGYAETYLDSASAPWGEPLEVEIDAMRLGQLRALGYMREDQEGE
jgi:hypothetical protein